jgi:hypothetical protein
MGSPEFEALEQTLQKVSEDLKSALNKIQALEEENNYLRSLLENSSCSKCPMSPSKKEPIMKGRIFAVDDAPCSNNVIDYDM